MEHDGFQNMWIWISDFLSSLSHNDFVFGTVNGIRLRFHEIHPYQYDKYFQQ